MSERPTFTDRWESVAVVHDASKADEMFDVYLEGVGHPVCGHTDCLTVPGMAVACRESDPEPWRRGDRAEIEVALKRVQHGCRTRMLTGDNIVQAVCAVADGASHVLVNGGFRDSVRGGGNQTTTYAMIAPMDRMRARDYHLRRNWHLADQTHVTVAVENWKSLEHSETRNVEYESLFKAAQKGEPQVKSRREDVARMVRIARVPCHHEDCADHPELALACAEESAKQKR